MPKIIQTDYWPRAMGGFQGGKILGYVTLVCGEIAAEDDAAMVDAGSAGYRYKHYPAVKIARLAVDRGIRGSGLGRNLVEFALGMAKHDISTIIGCRFVVVDAKQESVEFYKKVGFRLLDTPANHDRSEPIMFIDLLRV